MDIEAEVAEIKARNLRVEADKAWETSAFRISAIAGLIYVFAVVFLFVSGVPNPFLGALIPPAGYLISAQSLPPLKKWWIKNVWKEKSPS